MLMLYSIFGQYIILRKYDNKISQDFAEASEDISVDNIKNYCNELSDNIVNVYNLSGAVNQGTHWPNWNHVTPLSAGHKITNT